MRSWGRGSGVQVLPLSALPRNCRGTASTSRVLSVRARGRVTGCSTSEVVATEIERVVLDAANHVREYRRSTERSLDGHHLLRGARSCDLKVITFSIMLCEKVRREFVLTKKDLAHRDARDVSPECGSAAEAAVESNAACCRCPIDTDLRKQTGRQD